METNIESVPGKSMLHHTLEKVAEAIPEYLSPGDVVYVAIDKDLYKMYTGAEVNAFLSNFCPTSKVNDGIYNLSKIKTDFNLVFFDKVFTSDLNNTIFVGIGSKCESFCLERNLRWVKSPSELSISEIIDQEILKHQDKESDDCSPLIF